MKPSRAKVEVNDALQVTLSQGASRLAIQLDREHARALGVALIEYAGREAPLRGGPLRGAPHRALPGSARPPESETDAGVFEDLEGVLIMRMKQPLAAAETAP